ncbi:MAG: apolipoprotein N-acyltransferase [Sulfurovum sp.]|nr:apolipoprotein N-acyltransferase [Sulfurovum sp.]
MFKIGKYFTTYSITAGLSIAMLGSVFLYLAWIDSSNRLIETISGILFFYFLLKVDRKIWFWSGFFISLLWFWWIVVSFKHYDMLWAIPIGLLFISIIYGFVFWFIAIVSECLSHYLQKGSALQLDLLLKALGLLLLSSIHPLGFDWLKPELLFVHSYIGVQKWQLALVLLAIILAQYKKNLLFLLLILLSYSPTKTFLIYHDTNDSIAISNTMITVKDKWNANLIPSHIDKAFEIIDNAISRQKQMVVLPESIFPFFLNNEPKILGELLKRSKNITIVMGALYLDGTTHRNSTYIIQDGKYKVANKVLLVPFGESNPLPEWAGKWVNKIFFDGAIDYIASAEPTDFEVDDTVYRNAICYEGTSEKLYKDIPSDMIVISNNGWFAPSIEPTLQRLLLEFYSRKYGTTIYHSINMSPSYIIRSTKLQSP